jgi:ATP-dependent Lon protease
MLDSEQRPVLSPLVKELPEFLQETAFLDRLRGILPGWKVRKLSGDSFAQGVGLKSDFFGDALLALREDVTSNQFASRTVTLKGKKLYKRNEDAVCLLASGLMKLQFPHGQITAEDFETYCVRPAVELRQLVWDQLYMLDAEYRQFDEEIEYEILSE